MMIIGLRINRPLAQGPPVVTRKSLVVDLIKSSQVHWFADGVTLTRFIRSGAAAVKAGLANDRIRRPGDRAEPTN
jgi:hypothetical protein